MRRMQGSVKSRFWFADIAFELFSLVLIVDEFDLWHSVFTTGSTGTLSLQNAVWNLSILYILSNKSV